MKKYIIKNKQIINKNLNSIKCDAKTMSENFTKWICEVLNLWYEQKNEDIHLSDDLLRTMHVAYKSGISPEDWL